jgi:choline dehydrogenase-like flavoprotein
MTLERIIIIGSGAGGGAAAWRLTSKGFNVTVLEAGPRYDPMADYRQDQNDWETSFPQKPGSISPYVVAQLQDLIPETADIRSWSRANGPYVPGSQRVSFGYHHVRGVGGSSLHFTGEAHRMNPRSMRMQSDFGVAADWPVGYDDLAPYWDIAEAVVGVSGQDDDPYRPRTMPYPMPPLGISYASQTLANGARQLGLSPMPNALAVPSEPYRDRPDCNYCGGCLRGCQRGDKGSIDVTYLREAEATGRCTIITGAEVLNILTNHEKITSLRVAINGAVQTMTADAVILAAGAVQTPRILLNSKSEHSPNGLSNESGQVGRNLMETLLVTTSALHPEQQNSHQGMPVDWVAWDYNTPDAIDGIIGGCRFGPAMAESDLVGPIAYASRIATGWGADFKSQVRAMFGRILAVAGIGESLPNERTFVDLAAQTDAYGMPVAQIHSYLDDMAIKRLRFMINMCRNIVQAAGCDEIVEEFSSVDAFSSTHIFGTCRMGHDPQNSVVNDTCQSHRWPNLIVADASVFPSSGGGESPGLTIQALSIRAADHLIERG